MPSRWIDIADTLRRQTRRLFTLRGMAWLGLAIVSLLWVAGFADWLLRFEARWVRLMLTAGTVALLGATFWRTVWRPLSVRLSDIEVARMIERRFPQWGDRLSSAAQFRNAKYSRLAGSPELQRETTGDVDLRLEEIAVDQVLQTEPTRRLVWAAGVVVAVGVTGALWQSNSAVTALTRLALPFADVSWPRTTQLQFLDDDLRPVTSSDLRTAAGEPLTLYLENLLGPLPEDVLLQLRLPNGDTEDRSLQSTLLRDTGGTAHEVGMMTFTAHAGPVRYRAIGGDDDDMPWHTLQVVSAPSLTNLTITIAPPGYTGRQPRVLNGAGAFEAIVGSRVRFQGDANVPLASAAIRREGKPPQRMALSDDGRHVESSFVVDEAGRAWYWFDIRDAHGLTSSSPPRYEFRGIADRKPTVYIEQPDGDITVTANANLPLRVIARDDLGIKALQIVHSQPNAEPMSFPLEVPSGLPTESTVEVVWSLAPLGLAAGDRITFHAEALDAFDLPAGEQDLNSMQQRPTSPDSESVPSLHGDHVGISSRRHIIILSVADKQQELASRQMTILDTLQELQERQSRAQETTAGLRIQAELAESLLKEDLDLLKQTELEQQNIREAMSDSQAGVVAEIARLQGEQKQNQIDDPQLERRLAQLSIDVGTLTDELLPVIEQSLARTRKLSQPAEPADDHSSGNETRESGGPAPDEELQRAEQTQAEAIAVLKAATSELGIWQRRYEVTSEIDALIVNQADIQQETQAIGRETFSKPPGNLTPQERASLARLSDRQRRLATRLDELIKQGTREPTADGESSAVMSSMQAALRRLAERRTTHRMHSAAEALRLNDIAGTTESHEQILEDLRDFGELLQSVDDEVVETLLATIEQQTEEVETLRKRQTELARAAQQAMGPTADPEREQQLERLVKEQERLANRADDLERQLRRQQRMQSAQTAARAGRRMRDARQGMEREQPEETAANQQEALADLAQLAVELAEQQQQIERELARQQIEQLADNLQEVADGQETLIARTTDLADRRTTRGSWSRSLRKELREATDEQSALADRVNELRESVADYPVIGLSLEQVTDSMAAATERMTESDVGQETLEHQRIAHRRILAIVDVARESAGPHSQVAADAGPTQNRQGPPDAQEPPQLLGTQLRLLRHLQADVQERTIALSDLIAQSAPDAETVDEERKSLARDQSRIAVLMRQLLEQFAQPPVDIDGKQPNPGGQP